MPAQVSVHNIHRRLEKIFAYARDASGALDIQRLVHVFWREMNNDYYVIAVDCYEEQISSEGLILHEGSNIAAGYYLDDLAAPDRQIEGLEARSPLHIKNTIVYFMKVGEHPQQVVVIAFRPQLDEQTRDILVSTMKFLIIEHIRLDIISSEYQQARIVQTSLLPKRFDVNANYAIHCESRSCHIVSGDAYDVIALDPTHTGIMIADALGHGFPAALQARDVIIGIRMGLRIGSDLARIMDDLNRIINQTRLTSRFVSVLLGCLDDRGGLRYVNAGHLPPIIIGNEGVTTADVHNAVVGPLENPQYKVGIAQIEPGGMVIMYTDGITEATNQNGNDFGKDALVDCIMRHADKTPAEIVSAVFKEVESFTGKTQDDDMTLLVIRRL